MEMIDMSDIGEIVKELRTDKGWTQSELEDTLWLDKGTVNAIERGNGDVSFVDVVSVLRVLDVTVLIRKPAKLP